MRRGKVRQDGRRLVAATVVALALCVLVISLSGCDGQGSGSTRPSGPLPHVNIYFADYDVKALDLTSLVQQADVIIVGTVVEGPSSRWNSEDGRQWKPRSKADGPQFYTTWKVAVEESLKGPYSAGDTAVFHFNGGDVQFDGRWAHYTGNDFPEGLATGDYVLVFGSTFTSVTGVVEPPGYWLWGGGYGVFRGPPVGGRLERLSDVGYPGIENNCTVDEVRKLLTPETTD
jgi:hypothetical protein